MARPHRCGLDQTRGSTHRPSIRPQSGRERRFSTTRLGGGLPLQPPRFLAVGEWYDEFSQVSDQEVMEMLGEVGEG
ncbi:MAG: hypothetical protein ACRDXD_03480 [Acidimicrobiia bacterium]